MDNKEWTIKQLRNYRNYIFRIRHLDDEIERMEKHAAPANHLTASFDANRGGYIPPSHEDAITMFQRVISRKTEKSHIERIVKTIESGLAMLDDDQRLLIIMRYIDECNVNTITAAFKYASRQSVYNMLDKSVTNFSHFFAKNA